MVYARVDAALVERGSSSQGLAVGFKPVPSMILI